VLDRVQQEIPRGLKPSRDDKTRMSAEVAGEASLLPILSIPRAEVLIPEYFAYKPFRRNTLRLGL
jgi:hypothetical protein